MEPAEERILRLRRPSSNSTFQTDMCMKPHPLQEKGCVTHDVKRSIRCMGHERCGGLETCQALAIRSLCCTTSWHVLPYQLPAPTFPFPKITHSLLNLQLLQNCTLQTRLFAPSLWRHTTISRSLYRSSNTDLPYLIYSPSTYSVAPTASSNADHRSSKPTAQRTPRISREHGRKAKGTTHTFVWLVEVECRP
jgi:hypothetical protein